VRATNGKIRTILSWSSGKDSAWSLHVLRTSGEVEVAGLLTTVNEAYARVAMHAVRIELLEAQAEAAGLPLWQIPLPNPCSNELYEAAMRGAVERARTEKIEAFAFGDLFLEEIRAYREDRLKGSGLRPMFPIWQRPTRELAREMIAAGLRARVTCVDPKQLPASFAGRDFDESFLADMPPGIDPCGERGEFHTFAYDGPMFSRAIPIRSGEIVERGGFVFADLMLGDR
jgi:uncharacterized protein (TIGR00290 family)